MLNWIKNYFRNRALRKHRSSNNTGFLPLHSIHKAIALIDVEDNHYDECKEAILSFFKTNNIKGEIFFFDFRKISKEELLTTSIKNTILKKDLNWYGGLNKEKTNLIKNTEADLLISIVHKNSFALEFFTKISPARFKVGRNSIDGDTFDLTLNDNKKSTNIIIFREILNYLNKIQ